MKLTLCLPDIHFPDHDPRALKKALSLVKIRKPDRVVLLGDVVDFSAISRFPKSPRHTDFGRELQRVRPLLRQLYEALERVPRVDWLAGNHEERLQKYLWRRAPELAEVGELTVPRLLEMPAGWRYHPPRAYLSVHGVLVFHGFKWASNTCTHNLGRYGCSSIQGHSHRLAVYYRGLPGGRVIAAAEAGCLCRLDVPYAMLTDWAHGVAWIWSNGEIEIERIR